MGVGRTGENQVSRAVALSSLLWDQYSKQRLCVCNLHWEGSQPQRLLVAGFWLCWCARSAAGLPTPSLVGARSEALAGTGRAGSDGSSGGL